MPTLYRCSLVGLCILLLAACGDHSQQTPTSNSPPGNPPSNPPGNPNTTDSDNDGVIDSVDQCANTPANTIVDAIGCPLPSPSPNDADSDGISDANDACPATPAGLSVNADGCSATLCQAVISGAASQCFDNVASTTKDCYLDNGTACYNDNAVTAAIQTQQALIQAQCGTDATVQEAGYGDLLTLANLQLLQEDACIGNVQSLAARSFGGPHAKLLANNANNPANTACLEAVYDQGQALITGTYDDYDACINDGECADFNGFTAPNQAGRDNTATATLTGTCAGNMSETQGSTPAIFIERANAQARCMIAETNGDTSAVSLDCGPDNAFFQNLDIRQDRVIETDDQREARNDTTGKRLVLEEGNPVIDIDNLPRDIGLYIEMDSDDWGTVCGDGSPYAIVLRFSSNDDMLDNALFHQQGGGVCLTGGDCNGRPQHLFEAIDHSNQDLENDLHSDGGYLSTDSNNPFADWSVVYQPYCNQDLHIGGGGTEPGGRSDNDGQVRRFGAINVRKSTQLYRDLLWRLRRHSTTTGYRSQQPEIVYSGTSAGGYGVQYNLHHPLDEMRWENTLGSPHVAFTQGGGTTDLGLLFSSVGNTWMTRAYQPPYCLEDNCSLSEFNHAAHSERLGNTPMQIILNTTAQHDHIQESTQGYPGPLPNGVPPPPTKAPKDWIDQARASYCRMKDLPHVYFHFGANRKETHDFLNSDKQFQADSPFTRNNQNTRELLINGQSQVTLLANAAIHKQVVTLVEDGLTLPDVQPFPCDITPPGVNDDADNDGVMNAHDLCGASTTPVAANGCTLVDINDDPDQDGISNGNSRSGIDECPDTPNTEAADEFGCSRSQIDQDMDGIDDADDNCPFVANPDQAETDPSTTTGDACDPVPSARPRAVSDCYQANLLVAPDISLQECTWNHFAHDLQRDLDADTPMVESLWLASHNSFNYPTPEIPSSSDPNQFITIPEQLDLEMRGVELDIHWTEKPRCSGNLELLICHAFGNHSTCSGTEPTVDGYFEEIRDWLIANPDEVIHLDIQAEYTVIDTRQPSTSTSAPPYPVCPPTSPDPTGADDPFKLTNALLKNIFGDLLYTPADSGENNLPLQKTRNDIVAANRQVIVTSEQDSAEWLESVHKLSTVRKQGANRNIGDGGFEAYPNCDSDLFDDANDFRTNWTRVWEDATTSGSATANNTRGPLFPVDESQIQEMLKCGLNMPSFDRLRANDTRLTAMVWSWAETEPAINDEANCALHNADGRFESADCTATAAYACADANNTNWIIATPAGVWADGVAACNGLGLQFATPQTGYFNQLLREAKTSAGVTNVWLNYSEDAVTEGIWAAQ